jgi:hypothetical protein
MPVINQPDTQEQEAQPEKLVLPASPSAEQQMYYGGQKTHLRPEQLIRNPTQPAPKGAGARIAYYWRKDPAYKVLMIAMTTVLLAGIIFVSLASAAFLGNPNLFASSTSQTVPKGANPTGTVNLRRTFPTPGGGSGSSQSSQPPMQQTPALQPTATGQPSPTPGSGGALNVQITRLPSQVVNGSIVNVGVNTSQPGVSVLLVIHYNVQGGRNTAGPQITDTNGNATIPWFVWLAGFGKKSVQAFVYAVVTDQNGQQVKSQTVIVQVVTRGMGG